MSFSLWNIQSKLGANRSVTYWYKHSELHSFKHIFSNIIITIASFPLQPFYCSLSIAAFPLQSFHCSLSIAFNIKLYWILFCNRLVTWMDTVSFRYWAVANIQELGSSKYIQLLGSFKRWVVFLKIFPLLIYIKSLIPSKSFLSCFKMSTDWFVTSYCFHIRITNQVINHWI